MYVSSAVPTCRLLGRIVRNGPCYAQDTKSTSNKEAQSSDDLDLMAEDMKDYGAEISPSSAPGSAQQNVTSSSAPASGLKQTIDKVLIADFFFILCIMLWFGVGLGERAALKSMTLLDTWYALWPTVFQPALGVLMLGALVSGLVGRGEDK